MPVRWQSGRMLITTRHDHHDVAADAVVLRRARAADARALTRLAALDDAAPLAGEALVAEQDGELRAAISLHSGRAIADPFHPTAGPRAPAPRACRTAARARPPAGGASAALLRRPVRAA